MSDAKGKLRADWNAFTDTLAQLAESAVEALGSKAEDIARERLVHKRTELENELTDVEDQIVTGAIKDLHNGLLMGEVVERWQLPHAMLDDIAAKAKREQDES